MTILNEIPIKGLAKDFMDNDKFKKASLHYLIQGQTGKIGVLVKFNDGNGRGLGGACFAGKYSGYLMHTEDVKPYKYETQKNLRNL